MKVVIDRFEGDFAVVELPNGEVVNVNKKIFSDAVEGDVINIFIDSRMNNEKKAVVQELVNDLFDE